MSIPYTLHIQDQSTYDPNPLQLHTKVWALTRGRVVPMKIRTIRINEYGIFYSLFSITTDTSEPAFSLDNVPLSHLNDSFFLSEEQAKEALLSEQRRNNNDV